MAFSLSLCGVCKYTYRLGSVLSSHAADVKSMWKCTTVDHITAIRGQKCTQNVSTIPVAEFPLPLLANLILMVTLVTVDQMHKNCSCVQIKLLPNQKRVDVKIKSLKIKKTKCTVFLHPVTYFFNPLSRAEKQNLYVTWIHCACTCGIANAKMFLRVFVLAQQQHHLWV